MAEPGSRTARRLTVLADDLTGAGDAAGPFAARGLRTAVVLAAGDAASAGAEVVAVDLDCRDAEVPPLPALPDGPVLVKVDSLGRGRPGRLLAAVAAARGVPVLLCPAWPAAGRPVRDGWTVDGGFSRVDWPSVLDGVPVRTAPTAGVAERLLADAAPGTVVLADAEDEEDLRELASVAGAAVLAGAAGLASGVAAELADDVAGGVLGAAGGALRVADDGPGAAGGVRGPVLVVAGSRDAASRGQAAVVRGLGGVRHLGLDSVSGGDEVVAMARAAADALRGGTDVLVTAPGADADTGVVDAWFAAFAPCLPLAGLAALTGGATARALLDAAGVRELRDPVTLAPGVTAYHGPATTIVTKPGSLGPPETLADLVRTARAAPGPVRVPDADGPEERAPVSPDAGRNEADGVYVDGRDKERGIGEGCGEDDR
ncbi:MAG TPA: four-carbon acid sugar kinase family protein [Streptosporangiaceae bacterium]|jgi:uncharacterized protein YgbK (DUF1537 family)